MSTVFIVLLSLITGYLLSVLNSHTILSNLRKTAHIDLLLYINDLQEELKAKNSEIQVLNESLEMYLQEEKALK